MGPHDGAQGPRLASAPIHRGRPWGVQDIPVLPALPQRLWAGDLKLSVLCLGSGPPVSILSVHVPLPLSLCSTLIPLFRVPVAVFLQAGWFPRKPDSACQVCGVHLGTKVSGGVQGQGRSHGANRSSTWARRGWVQA